MDKKMQALIDGAAYKSPFEIPREIAGSSSEKSLARLYFRFMCVLYELYKNGAAEEKMKTLKREFETDLGTCFLLSIAAMKSVREQNKLNFALYECNKNSEKCVFCKAVSSILGKNTAPEEMSDV